MVIYAAKAKKHIFCEKPIEITKKKLDVMTAAVRENGIKMGCVFQKRTFVDSLLIKKAVDEGKFGKLILCDVYMKYYRSQAYYDSADWRGTWKLDGGGALMNQGVHGIDQLLWIAGDVESVYARVATLTRKIDVEDTALAILKFKNGAFGIIEGTTSVYPGQDTRIEIHGEKGSVIFGDMGIAQWKVEGDEEEKAPEIKKENISIKDNPTKFPGISHLPLIRDLIEAIENGREPFIPPEEARKSVDLILAIYESAKTGKEVRL